MNIYLDKLELHGFKSFPEKTIIKFHKGITAVIGPNGCGKSNIVDAVLWVLGEQKIKSLRGENNEDLIFNGSADKKPLGMTEVGAYFIKNYEPVHIARRYYRSSETKYILNEKFSRNKDIQNTLYDMQMGEKKYFIFEQGSIDKLVSLKAGEKRILIEEAAGVSQYLERKKETVNKLIIAEQNLESLDMLIFDKEKRLKELKNQVNYVQRYRSFKIEKINNLKALIHKKYTKIQKEVKTNINLKDENIKKESLLSKEITFLEKTLLDLEEEKWTTNLKQKEYDRIKFDINSSIISTQKEIEKTKQQKDFTNQQSIDLKKDTDKNILELKNIKPELEKIEKDFMQLNIDLKKEIKNKDTINTEISSLKSDFNKYKNENHNFKSEIFKIKSEISFEKNRLNKLERTKFSNENEIKNKKKRILELNNTDLEKESNIITKDLTNLEADFLKEKEALLDLKKQQSIQQENINKNRIKINEIENEISSLKKQKEKYLEIKKKISGTNDNVSTNDIYLQDVIETDKINYKSIENYYFDEMDSIFLDNIKNLKLNNKNKYILIRNNINDISEQEKIINEAGFISFISSIYETKEIKHKKSLKDGIIVDNLSNGINIFLKYGFGIITKKSEIITKDGIIILNRDKGILNINKEINDAEIKIKKLSTSLSGTIEKQKKIKDSYHILVSSIEQTQTSLRSKEKDIYHKKSSLELKINEKNRNINRLEILKEELGILNNDNIKIISELKVLDKNENKLKQKESELIKKNEEYSVNLEKKKDKINEIEKNFLKQQSSINLINEKIKSITSKTSSLKEMREKLKHKNLNNDKKLKNIDKNIKDADNRIIILKKDLERSDIKSKSNDTSLKNIGTESNNINEKIKKNTSELNRFRIELSEIKEIKSEVEIILSGYKKDAFQLEDIALKELNDELRNIKGTEEFLSKNLDILEKEVNIFNERLNKMRDSEKLNFSAESEYDLLYKDHGFLINQKDDVINSIQDMHEVIEKIDSESKTSFLKAFNEIKENFVKNFQILFEGGDATLSLTDQSNLLETGLDIKAQPPGKQLLSLRLLSGGEKTLTSLAFLFALFQYKPAPFCIFDEVDASLDEANIQRFLKFLHILKKNTQFLIITHNFKTMEEADYLYGISMNKPGISTIYSTKFSNNI